MLAQIKIAPVKSAILIIYDGFNYLIINNLFADAEMFEDVLKDGVGRNFAYDIGEVVDAFTQILRDEVARETRLHAILYTLDGVECRD